MKRKLTIIGSVFAILALSFFLMNFLSQQKEEIAKPKAEEIKRYVKTTQVQYNNIPTELIAYGRVNSSLPLDITAEVSGKMLQGDVSLRAGQNFAKGALLFKVDDTETRLRLQASKSSFLKDIASILPDFKIDFAESYPAWQSYFNAIEVDKPLPELPKHKNSQEKTFLATKNIYNAYYTIKSTEENLKKHKVYAPFSGTISEVLMQIGSFVNPGNKIAKTLKTSALELNVAVNPNDIKWVKTGSVVEVQTEVGDQAWKGKVVRIGDVLNANTQALDVFIQVISDKNKIYEGMYLKATMPGSRVENAMEIPRAALVGNEKVYTLQQDSLLSVRTINIHKLNAETAIVSGLQLGDELVVEPMIGAYEGMKVFRLKEEEKTAKNPEKVNNKEDEDNV